MLNLAYGEEFSFSETGTHSSKTYPWKAAEEICNFNNADFSITSLENICEHKDDALYDVDLYWTGYKRYWYKSASNMSAGELNEYIW